MPRLAVTFVLLISLSACSTVTIPNVEMPKIPKIPDEPGNVYVDCSYGGYLGCFETAADVCQGGYEILEKGRSEQEGATNYCKFKCLGLLSTPGVQTWVSFYCPEEDEDPLQSDLP